MTERNLPPLLDAAGKFPAERRETFRRLFAQEVFAFRPHTAPLYAVRCRTGRPTLAWAAGKQ